MAMKTGGQRKAEPRRSAMMANRVWVAGSINVDLVAWVDRFPVPGQTVVGRQFDVLPGGKGANQAVAAARLGAPCSLLAAVGEDDFATLALSFLRRQGIDLMRVKAVPWHRTGCALITVAEGDNCIVVASGANAALTAADLTTPLFAAGDILLAQLETPADATASFFAAGRAAAAVTVLNAAPAGPAGRPLLPLADILVLNESELCFFAGYDPQHGVEVEEVPTLMRRLRAFPGQRLVVTLGKNGVVALQDEHIIRIPGRHVQVVDTTGAGDSFTGALAARLAQGDDFAQALLYANVAASLTVQRPGAGPAMPMAEDVAALVGQILSAPE